MDGGVTPKLTAMRENSKEFERFVSLDQVERMAGKALKIRGA